MTDVARIYTNTSGVSTSFARTGFFDSAISKQNNWRGGAKHSEEADKFSAVEKPGIKTEEKAADEKPAPAQTADMRKFYSTSSAYFPPVDYYQTQREAMLFESIKDRAGLSSSWKQDLLW